MRWQFVPLIVMLVLVVLIPTSAVRAEATAFIINSDDDAYDGICNTTHCSLREAVVAANNTAGPKTIRFVPALKGTIIALSAGPLPIIIGDDTTLDGDVDGDGTADITLSGSACQGCTGLLVAASGVTISGLKIVDFYVGIGIQALRQPSIARVVILNNTITGSHDHIMINHNNTQGRVIGNITIRHNTLAQGTFLGINISGGSGPQASANEVRNVTIADNAISGGAIGIFANGGLVSAVGNLLSGITITHNVVSNTTSSGIVIGGGSSGPGTQGNRAEAVIIAGNTITGTEVAIEIPVAGTLFPPPQPLPAGRSLQVSDNVVTDVTIVGNILRKNVGGIQINGAFGDPNHPEAPVRLNTASNITITGNTITDSTLGNGIFLNGAYQASENSILNINIVNNLVANNGLLGEYIPAQDRRIPISLSVGILALGGDGKLANGNVIQAVQIINNTVVNNSWVGIRAKADNGGTGNQVSQITVKNSIVWLNGDLTTLVECQAWDPASFFDISSTIGDPSCADAPLTTDPLFVAPGSRRYTDPPQLDFRLRPGSPAIDTGLNAVAGLPTTDLDGNPRILDGDGDGVAVVDIGAYEFNRPPSLTLTGTPTLTPRVMPPLTGDTTPGSTAIWSLVAVGIALIGFGGLLIVRQRGNAA